MARSYSVHVVQEFTNVIAAFTVKHELLTFLERHKGQIVEWDITRVVDGGSDTPPVKSNALQFLSANS